MTIETIKNAAIVNTILNMEVDTSNIKIHIMKDYALVFNEWSRSNSSVDLTTYIRNYPLK